MSSDETTLDLLVRTALALREQSGETRLSDDELFKATRAFLDRARVYHHPYVKHYGPLWYELAFLPPVVPLEEAARRITGERSQAAAWRALERFIVTRRYGEGSVSRTASAQISATKRGGVIEIGERSNSAKSSRKSVKRHETLKNSKKVFHEMEVNAGRLRACTIGGRTVRFLEDDVRKWLTQRATVEAEEQVPA